MKISIVSPVYKGEAIVEELVSKIYEAVTQLEVDFEIILVEDGSPDNSWEKIREASNRHRNVKGIKLSRNFGQHYAVTAGLNFATGSIIILMDCDLQDDPKFIPLLLAEYKMGNEIVFTRRIDRKHSFVKSLNSATYNFFFGLFSDRNYDVNAGSMVLFSQRVNEVFLKLEDKDRLYLQMLKWIGFKSTYVAIEHKERFAGKSTYTFYKLLKLAIQGWTSHSDKLLKFSVYSGFFLSFITFVIAIVIFIKYYFFGLQPGWPSLFLAIIFGTGLILMSIGITGVYIGKIFEQTKNRPLFIVDEKINFE